MASMRLRLRMRLTIRSWRFSGEILLQFVRFLFAGQTGTELLVTFGEDRTRHSSAAEIQRYAGIAPVVERSGKKAA